MFQEFQRERLQSLWQARLKDAKVQYSVAADRFKTASMEFGNRTLPTPDGGANLLSAIRAESTARHEYLRVLRIFTAVVVSGKRPEG